MPLHHTEPMSKEAFEQEASAIEKLVSLAGIYFGDGAYKTGRQNAREARDRLSKLLGQSLPNERRWAAAMRQIKPAKGGAKTRSRA